MFWRRRKHTRVSLGARLVWPAVLVLVFSGTLTFTHQGSAEARRVVLGGPDASDRAGPPRRVDPTPNPRNAALLRSEARPVSALTGTRSHWGDGAPRRVVIPAIGVNSSLVPLGLNPDGTMEVPAVFNEAGWFTGGPKPGDPGPAVIAGHVSSRAGPAVFYRLAGLRPGDVIQVLRA